MESVLRINCMYLCIYKQQVNKLIINDIKHCLNVGFPGGFSDTYAALCDLNEMPFREEIQWVS